MLNNYVNRKYKDNNADTFNRGNEMAIIDEIDDVEAGEWRVSTH